MNIAQSSSNVICQLEKNAPLNGQPNVKRQKLDEDADSTAAIPIDEIADEDDDDSGIEILEDEDDDDVNTAVVTVDTQGNAATSTPHAANTAGSSTFTPFMLMDHHPVMADIKGKNCKKILNQL